MGKRFNRVAAPCLAVLSLALPACAGPLAVPPAPTPNPLVVPVAHNHVHGEGGAGGRLITRYGGPTGVSLSLEPQAPTPGTPVEITYALNDAQNVPLTAGRLRIVHERVMHLIVVSQDLQSFSHVHPEEAAPGRYSVTETLPRAGKYVLFDEFVTAEGVTQIERNVVATEGAESADNPAALAPDLGTTKESAGLQAVLTSPIDKVRRRVPTPFFLEVTKDGKPATDLQPFLGAACHVVVISADTKQFAHTHGDIPGGALSGDMSKMDMAAMPMPTPPASFGPRLEFTHTFMQPGMYRLWVQLGHGGEVATFAYNVMVER
ncbi:MAG TPA: hypothetical protein VFR15_20685 [Chloroflexia bacterium]|nr:hypothetical protein [Chloroflexia bacterium]